jgi:hypothetical protein
MDFIEPEIPKRGRGRPKGSGGGPHVHKRMKLEKPRDVLKILQDAINDLRRAEEKTDIFEQSARAHALAYTCRAWLEGYDKYLLFEKAEAQQKQLEVLLARTQPQQGNGAAKH